MSYHYGQPFYTPVLRIRFRRITPKGNQVLEDDERRLQIREQSKGWTLCWRDGFQVRELALCPDRGSALVAADEHAATVYPDLGDDG